jgi:O-antigen ligase
MTRKKISLSNHHSSFYTKAIEASIIALVVLVPIAFYPRCITVFIPAKEVTAEVLIVLGLMFWGIKMVSEEKLKFTTSLLDLPILSFMAICIFSLFWSNNPFVSLKELPLFLAGPLLYFIITNNIDDKRQIDRILNVLLIIGGLFGIYGILQYNGIDFPFWRGNVARMQVFGLFGNVNYFAEYLIAPLPIAISIFFVTRNKFKKFLLLIGILAMGTTLIVTFTRGSYLSVGISLIFMFFLYIVNRGKNFLKENKKIFIIILTAIIIVAFLFIIPTPLSKPGTAISQIKRRVSITQLTGELSFGKRIAIWKYTVLMIKDHPLLGSGIGTFKYNSLKYQAKFFDQGQNRSLYPYGVDEKVHNEYLQLWAEIGIIGLGIFIWLMISYFNYGIKLLKRVKDRYNQGIIIGLMGSVIAVLVDCLFGFPLHLSATVVLFWLALVLTMVVAGIEVDVGKINMAQKKSNKKEKKEKNRKITRFKPFLYICIILLSLFLCVSVVRPFVARTYWYYGSREFKNKNWNEAIKIYEEALKWDPYLGQVYYNIGNILINEEFYITAQEYLEKAEKYIDHPNLPRNLASVYLKKGMLDKVAIKLKQAISYQKNKKSMVPLYGELGNTYLHLNRYKTAEIAYKNALKINQNYVNAHYGLAGVYLRQNRLEEALEELQKVIELAPDSEEAEYAREIMQKIEQAKLEAQPTENDNP